MATAKYAVDRNARWPFLMLQPLREDRSPRHELEEIVELTGDEYADYEETLRKFANWQKRLAGG